MSERAAAFGNLAPALTIEHAGKVYAIKPVITEGVMLAVEQAMYDRERKPLVAQRDDMPEAAYLERLDALREKHKAGGYAFEAPETTAFLKTQKGVFLLLGCMMDATEGEILTLLMERGPELQDTLNRVLEASFPEGKGPKAKAPGKRGRR